jgi:hypothetical protein
MIAVAMVKTLLIALIAILIAANLIVAYMRHRQNQHQRARVLSRLFAPINSTSYGRNVRNGTSCDGKTGLPCGECDDCREAQFDRHKLEHGIG